ncbi:hypothetical protein NL676_009803 [Syzygium grande]|nr:hypothetical protein NL676_009803 [Syzygium grande]
MMIGRHHGSKLAGATPGSAGPEGVRDGLRRPRPLRRRGRGRGGEASLLRPRPRSGDRLAQGSGDRAAPREHPGSRRERGAAGQARVAGSDGASQGEKAIASYWGVEPSKVTKGDGTEWRWTCFRPSETYKADLSIDLKKHHAPLTFLDKLAF